MRTELYSTCPTRETSHKYRGIRVAAGKRTAICKLAHDRVGYYLSYGWLSLPVSFDHGPQLNVASHPVELAVHLADVMLRRSKNEVMCLPRKIRT